MYLIFFFFLSLRYFTLLYIFSSLVWTITEHPWLQGFDLQSDEVGDLPKKSVILIYCNNYFNQLCWFFVKSSYCRIYCQGRSWNIEEKLMNLPKRGLSDCNEISVGSLLLMIFLMRVAHQNDWLDMQLVFVIFCIHELRVFSTLDRTLKMWSLCVFICPCILCHIS